MHKAAKKMWFTLAMLSALLLIASAAVAQAPKITSVTKILAQEQYQTITINGSGFGTQAAYTGDSDYIAINDNTDGVESGYPGNAQGLIVNSWTDSQIVLGGFTPIYGLPNVGDQLYVRVWNAQTGDGPAVKKDAVIAQKTTTTLTSSPNPSTDGEAVTFTAEVTTSGGGALQNGASVNFMKGTTVIGHGTISDGSATFTTSTLTVGTTSVTAEYGGDGKAIKGSKSKPVKQVVQE